MIPRPCLARHPEPVAATCTHCWQYEANPQYRALYGGDPATARPDLPRPPGVPARAVRAASRASRRPLSAIPCVHLGPPTGERRILLNCTADPPTTLVLRACAVHGACTEGHVARGTQCCRFCPDRKAGDAELEVTANGIGDHMMALSIAAGWKAAHPGRRLVLRVRHRQWVELFGGYDALTDGPPGLPAAWRAGNDGHTHFVERAAAAPWRELPPARELPAEAAAWAEPYRGCVVLAPYCLGAGRAGQVTNRDWPAGRWLALAAELEARGVRTVAIGAGEDALRLASFPERLAGMPAARVAALMRAAACVVANESGMGHLAGALQVPAVVLAAQLDGRQVHGFWPRTTVIQGARSCSGCHWRGPEYSRAKCEPVCPNLDEITPGQVLAAVGPHLPPPAWGDLPGAVRPHLARLVVPPCAATPVPDRRPTMAAFLRLVLRAQYPNVAETGCQRAVNDYGAGMSTTLIGLAIQGTGGGLVSLDNDPDHVALARRVAAGLPVDVIETDSVAWLRAYRSTNRPSLTAIYLDSLDTYQPGHAEHCMMEAAAALPLGPGVILIDDTWRDGDGWAGKGRLAVPMLLAVGWRVAVQGYQTLLVRD